MLTKKADIKWHATLRRKWKEAGGLELYDRDFMLWDYDKFRKIAWLFETKDMEFK